MFNKIISNYALLKYIFDVFFCYKYTYIIFFVCKMKSAIHNLQYTTVYDFVLFIILIIISILIYDL